LLFLWVSFGCSKERPARQSPCGSRNREGEKKLTNKSSKHYHKDPHPNRIGLPAEQPVRRHKHNIRVSGYALSGVAAVMSVSPVLGLRGLLGMVFNKISVTYMLCQVEVSNLLLVTEYFAQS